jgi:putative transposase
MYCLAFAMQKTGVLLHAACVMSDHHHLVVTDPRGCLPDFLRELHRLTAKAMNALQGQWENLWAAEACNVVRLVTEGDIADKIAYVVANPVAAGVVERPEVWPGFVAWGNKSFRVNRPGSYFSEDGSCPAELRLVLEVPRARSEDEVSPVAWVERVKRSIDENVALAHRAVRAAGKTFLGADGASKVSFARRARSYEERRGMIPTFAAKVGSVRALLQGIERDFRRRYREALVCWRGGTRDVAFPFGTWGMMVHHAAVIALPEEH